MSVVRLPLFCIFATHKRSTSSSPCRQACRLHPSLHTRRSRRSSLDWSPAPLHAAPTAKQDGKMDAQTNRRERFWRQGGSHSAMDQRKNERRGLPTCAFENHLV